MNLKPVKIGDVTVPHGLFLAPMAGMTDAAFRVLARRAGAEYAVSEMISALALTYRDKKTAELALIEPGDTPLALQLFGHDPEAMAKAAVMLATGTYDGCRSTVKPAAIDVNMGCPVHKIAGHGDGSALMKTPAIAVRIVAAIAEALAPYNVPVTVKIRAGWDAGHKNAPELAKALAEAGAAAIYVHARTRDQLYMPPIDPDTVARVRDAVDLAVPVIGNGDITTVADAEAMLKTGCDGLMIGRGALGNPWLFEEIAAAADGVPYAPPTAEARISAALSMVRAMVETRGERVAIPMVRGRAAYFIREIPGAASARGRLNTASTYAEVENILTSILR